MRTLSAADVLRIWEQGQGRHPLDQALTLLSAALPEARWEDLARLPVGRRDALLAEVRARTLGPHMQVLVVCPACRERLEMSVDTRGLLPEAPSEVPSEVEHGGFRVRFRLPDSRDLAALSRCGDPEAGRRMLIERCVLEAVHTDGPVAAGALPEPVCERLAAAMADADPGAELIFDLSCPACRHTWRAWLDLGDFMWQELDPLARRLLMEVDVLARAYHWREADILALGARRRQAYLELVGA